MMAATGVWAFVLLGRTPDWLPALRWIVLIGSVVVACALVVRSSRRLTAVTTTAAVLLGLAAPTAFAVYNVVHPASGPGTMSGPARGDDFGGPPMGGRPGGPPGAEVDNAALVSLLEVTDNRWAAATVDSMGAGGLQLSSGASVMAIGGFTGSDDSPTLAQFQQYVADSDVRYFIADQRGAPPDGPGDGGPPGGPPGRHGGSASEITEWVEQNFTSTDVGGATVYDLQAQ